MIISKTPFRVSFAGGGTDLASCYERYGGAVVSAAINKYMFITVSRKFDSSLRLSYSITEEVGSADELKHDIARECLNMVGITGGVEIVSISDIPKGTGLGSSSAFTVGLLNALHTFAGQTLSAHELAERACRVEIDVLGAPIGKQDQFASAYGGVNFFAFNPDGSVERERINLSEGDYKKTDRRLVMFYTGATRAANGILSEQSKRSRENADVLLRMRRQAVSLRDELVGAGFGPSFARTLDEGWRMKRSLAGSITNGAIDELYERGLAAGALGGKLLGAGGSGFLLFYCDEEKQDGLREAMGLPELDFRFSPYGSRIVYFD